MCFSADFGHLVYFGLSSNSVSAVLGFIRVRYKVLVIAQFGRVFKLKYEIKFVTR